MGVRTDARQGILKVERVREKLNRNVLLTRIGEALQEWMQTNFIRGGRGSLDLSRRSWEPIAASTKNKEGWRRPLVRTGELQSSSFWKITGGSVRAGYRDNKASFHHLGTRPHEITPRNASALRFPDDQGGIVFTKSVQHPGTPKRHLLPTRVQVHQIAVREIKDRLNEDIV